MRSDGPPGRPVKSTNALSVSRSRRSQQSRPTLGEQQDRTHRTDGGAGGLGEPRGLASGECTESKAGTVEHHRGEHESKTEGEPVGVGGNFGAVRETVEGGEECGEGQTGGEREAFGHGDHQAENKKRGGDHLFHARGNDAILTDGGGNGHQAGKRSGNEPAGASAELRGPDTDGNHGEEMVEAEDRMNKTAAEVPGKIMAAIVAWVGRGHGGEKGEGGDDLEKAGGEAGLHWEEQSKKQATKAGFLTEMDQRARSCFERNAVWSELISFRPFWARAIRL